jgi:hypothetical protein
MSADPFLDIDPHFQVDPRSVRREWRLVRSTAAIRLRKHTLLKGYSMNSKTVRKRSAPPTENPAALLVEHEINTIGNSGSRPAVDAPIGANLLEQIIALLRRFLVLKASEFLVIALWILHTYCWAAADTTPYLYLGSAEKRSGKTRALELLELLVFKPWLTGRVTAAALVRRTASQHPTLLLDECDAAFQGLAEYCEALRGILNSGNRRGGKVTTCVGIGVGIGTRDFDVFCPKALAGIGKLPDTVADRSIPIHFRRKSRTEKVSRFRRRLVEPEVEQIRQQLAAWATENVSQLEVNPQLPDELTDRQHDIVEPLLAIADRAGGDWPQNARAAVVEIFTGAPADDDSIGVQLLSAIRKVFDARKTDKLPSVELVEALAEMEDSPWPEYQNGRPLSPATTAKLLKPFDIGPRTIRTASGTPKGYLRQDFSEVWSRYCRSAPDGTTDEVACGPQHPPQSGLHAGVTENVHPPQDAIVAEPKPQESPSNQPVVADVAVAEPTGRKKNPTCAAPKSCFADGE